MKPLKIEFLDLSPVPIDLSNRNDDGWKWPFGSMKIGDCYTISDPREHDNAACSYKYHAKKKGMKFKRKTIGNWMHIWRVE